MEVKTSLLSLLSDDFSSSLLQTLCSQLRFDLNQGNATLSDSLHTPSQNPQLSSVVAQATSERVRMSAYEMLHMFHY